MIVCYNRAQNLGSLLSYWKINTGTGPPVSSYRLQTMRDHDIYIYIYRERERKIDRERERERKREREKEIEIEIEIERGRPINSHSHFLSTPVPTHGYHQNL
jgi:hypothetical protein